MVEAKLAYREALRRRTCPPCEARSDPQMEMHRRACPLCCQEPLERADDDLTAWAEVGEALARILLEPESFGLEPGQIRSISRSLAGWGEGNRYYNPPFVLVTEVIREPVATVRVAQIYDDPVLAGPGDLVLEELDGEFVETWNTYTLRPGDLGPCYGTIASDLLDDVRTLSAREVPAVEENSSLSFFRNLEVETGAYFSSRAVSETIQGIDSDGIESRDEFDLTDKVLDVVSRRQGKVLQFCTGTCRSNRERIARTKLPEAEMPLAAAGEEVLPVNRLRLGHGEPVLDSGLVSIDAWEIDEAGLRVVGTIKDAPAGQCKVSGFWTMDDGTAVEADEGACESPYFWLRFPKISAASGEKHRLAILMEIGA